MEKSTVVSMLLGIQQKLNIVSDRLQRYHKETYADVKYSLFVLENEVAADLEIIRNSED